MNKKLLTASITAITLSIGTPVYADGFFSKIFGGDKKQKEESVSVPQPKSEETSNKQNIEEEPTNQKSPMQLKKEKQYALMANIIPEEEFWENHKNDGNILLLNSYKALDNMLYNEAAELLIDASKKNVIEAKVNLAQLVQHDLISNEQKIDSIPILEEVAVSGNPHVQHILALLLLKENVVEGRSKEGALWIKKSAEGGNPMAQYTYANMLATGTIFKQDGQVAIFFLEKMGQKSNYPLAYRHIAQIYDEGMGVVRNQELALKNYEKASSLGDLFSTKKAGLMYQNGQGTEIDTDKALSYFLKGSEMGDPQSTYLWATLYSNTLNSGLTDYESVESWKRDEANKKAFDALVKAGENGYAIAYRYIGDMYVKMQQADNNYLEAVNWYKKAAEAGDTTSMRRLHNIYMEGGHGIEKDEKLAKSYIKDAITTRNKSLNRGEKVEAEFEIYYKKL